MKNNVGLLENQFRIIQNNYNYVTCKQTLWGDLGKGETRRDPIPPPSSPSQRVCLQANNCGSAGICDCGGSVVENVRGGRANVVIQIAVLECRNCCLSKRGGSYL